MAMTPTTTARRHRARRIRSGASPFRIGSLLGAATIASITLTVTATGATAAHAEPYPVPADVSATIEFPGATGSWTVPAGVTTITLRMVGEHGAGSGGVGAAAGGRASKVDGSVTVTPGQQLTFSSGESRDGTVAFGAGGPSGQADGCQTPGGRGGNASSVWIDETLLAVAAGGGGGGGGTATVAAGAGGAGGAADTDNAGSGEASAGGLGASHDANGVAGADAALCGGAGGGGGGGIHGGGGGGAVPGLSAGGGGGGASYIDPQIDNTLTVSPDPSSPPSTALLSYSLVMAASPGVTVQKMRVSEGGYPGVVTASGCASDASLPASAEIVALTPLGDGLFAQVPVSYSPNVPVAAEVLTVPLADVAMWIDVNQPADGTVVAVTVTCAATAGTDSGTADPEPPILMGTFVIPADEGGLGGPPPVSPPPVVETPTPTPVPASSPGATEPPAVGGPHPRTGSGALANTGAHDPLPTVLLGGLVPLALGALALAVMRRRRRTL